MKILSFGAGMQSTALALMACENAKNPETPWPLVPVYDVVIFCDLGMEPPWVKDQVEFTRKACEWAGVKFVVLDSPLYSDFMRNFGERRTITIDERCEYDDRYCSKCGKRSIYNFLNFCGYCGAPMTDEAVEIVMKRFEALHEITE